MSDEKPMDKIKIADASGVLKEYDVLAYIEIDSGNYIVYTDGKELNNGQIAIYINLVITDKDGEVSFSDVSNEEVQAVIAKLQERLVD